MWFLYELPHLNAAVYHASFSPCSVDNACHFRYPAVGRELDHPAMFLHSSQDHIWS